MPIIQENELKQQLTGLLTDQCVGIRQRLRTVHQRWLDSRAMWMNLSTYQGFHPTDTDNARYSPAFGRRTIERATVRVTKLVTPSVKWFEVQPMEGGERDDIRLANVDNYMWYVLRKKIKSRSNISQLARTMILYGMAILKTSVEIRNGQLWPRQRVVDPFSFHIYPETVTNIEEAEIVFEDFILSYERYCALAKANMVDEINRADIGRLDWPYHLVERLAHQGITDPSITSGTTTVITSDRQAVRGQLDRTMQGFLSMSEMWYVREDKLYQVYIAWNVGSKPRIVGFYESKYDQPLYRMAVHRPLPGETYTNGQAEDITELDTIQKDLFNQFISAVNFEQGVMLNGLGAQGRKDNWKMKGREIWDVNADDLNSQFKFIVPPNTSDNKLRAWQILVASIQSMGGAGSIAEGQPGRNMPRSGDAMHTLVNLGMADIQDIAEVLEQEVLTLGLSDIYKVSQFIPDAQLMRIPGGSAMYGGGVQSNLLRKQDIVPGDYEFDWVGSLQFQDEAENAQRMMIWLNLLPQLAPMLQQQGYMFNLAELIQQIWRYSLGQRGLSKVIVKMPPPEPPPPVTEDNPLRNDPRVAEALSAPQSGGSSPATQNGSAPTGQPGRVPGLQYNLPGPANGFVKQG